MSSPGLKMRKRSGSFQGRVDTRIEHNHHHLAGPFLPQTPLGSGFSTPVRTGSPVDEHRHGQPPVNFWLRWVVYPVSALQVLLAPVLLYVNWELLAPALGRHLGPVLEPYLGAYPQRDSIPNPFAPFFLLSGYVTDSKPDDPRYQKTYGDFMFIAYNIVFFSLVRQLIAIDICRPIARYFGIKKAAKLTRFGEQGHALVYWSVMGAWGFRIMRQLPTYWYRTEYFWIDYPHWDMKPELKCYYLMQIAFWAQQLFVLVLRLEKPRKDYWELVAHHLVTIWLVGWSYLMNLTLIGNAVYMSMDIPDAFLAFSKLLNYIQWERAKVISFATFIPIWTYFRHFLNFYILWSVWFQFDQIPEESQRWIPEEGIYMIWWMKYQVFIPIFLLQLIQLFWYYLILRILYRTVVASTTTDERSDDEDDEKDG